MLCATIEFAEQLLRGGDFVGLFLDIDVSPRTRPASTSKACNTWAALRSVKLSKPSSECLAVDRDDASRRIGNGAAWTKRRVGGKSARPPGVQGPGGYIE